MAYPEEPGRWHPALTIEPAAADVAALWGLPLYRVRPDGTLEAALVASAQVAGGDPWVVRLELRPGRWSDGRPVTATDVVATLTALRTTRLEAGLAALAGAEAVGDRVVRLRFTRPYARWQHLLAETGGVLPAHVLERGGLDAYRDGVPVSAGRFRLAAHEPGLSARFEAHPTGPLGAPRLASVEVLFTPIFETALGLLDDGRAQVALGYLALNPLQRATRVDGVEAGAPLGGTWTLVRWRGGGALGGPTAAQLRRAVATLLDVPLLVEGLLGPFGALAAATIPGTPGPWHGPGAGAALENPPAVSVLLPRWQEAPALTARAFQRALDAAGAEVELVRLEPDLLAAVHDEQGDGALLVRRDVPWPSLAARAPPDAPADLRARLEAADAATGPDAPDALEAQRALHADGHELPLYGIGVAHVWQPQVHGLTPSSWPGLAFAGAGEWWLDGPAAAGARPGSWAAAGRAPDRGGVVEARPRRRYAASSPGVRHPRARVAEMADAHG